MKKRLISLLLTLSMVFSMVPAMGIGVGATGAYHKDNAWCTMIPFAYRAASISSIDYFQAFKSILYYGYDSEKIQSDFEKTPFYVIYSDLYWDRSVFEEISGKARKLLTTAFSADNPIAELSNDDIYDALLMNALLDTAADNTNDSKSFSFWADLLEGFSDATVTIENTTYLFFSYIMDQDKSQLENIAKQLLSANDSEVISFVIDGETYKCDTILTSSFKKIKTFINDKFPKLDIDSKVSELGDFLDLLSYLATFVDEGKEWIDNISKYIYIYDNITVNAGLVLREMYSCTEDEYLQRAINKFSDIIADESIWSMLKAIFIDLGADLFLDVSVTVITDKIRGELTRAFPIYATALATFKFIDMFTNLSGREEQDYLIYITHNFNDALVKAMANIEEYLWANEKRHWSDYDAVMFGEAYTFGLRMCWRTLAQELNTATEYYKVFLSSKKYKEELGEDWESHVEWMRDLYLETKPNQLEETKLYEHCLDVIADGVTIKYDINGGNETIPNQTKKYHGYVNLSSVVPTKEGHVFKGWAFSTYTADDFLYQPGEEIGPYLKNLGNSLEACFCSDELILVAQWGTDESVVYNGNGDNVKGLPAAQPNTGHTLLSPAIPTRDGYKFLGWDTDSSVKSPTYKAGATNVYTGNGYVVLYAIWEKLPTITYNANGGTTVPASHENTVGNTNLSKTWPTWTGHTFLGWSEDPNDKTNLYAPGASYPKDGDVTLYAIWNKVVFNIIFDADGPDGDGGYFPTSNTTTITKTKPYGEAFVINVEKPVRPGYIFADKWTHLNPKTGRVETFDHDPNKTIYDIGDETTIDKVLYPVWTDATVDVAYDFNNNGANKNEIVKVDTSISSSHTILYPSDLTSIDETYFKGWMFQDVNGAYWWAGTTEYGNSYDNGKVSIIMPGQSIPISGDLVLYAKWDYYVHYNNNSTVTHDTVRDGEDYVIQAPVVAYNSDQVFKYWNHVDEEGNTTKYYAGDVIDLTSDLTLTAVWGTEDTVNTILTVLTDKASYEPGDTVEIEIIADNSGYFRVDASDNDGFKLEDAEGRKKASGVFVENSSKSDADDLKCYDNGESYTVELYIPDDCENGTYPIEIFASNGIYNEDSDSSVTGTETSTASETLIIKVDNGEEEKVYYTLSYHMNDGYGNLPDPVRFYDGEEVKLDSANGFKRDGYLFSGWCEKENGKGTLYEAGEYCSFDEDTLLYAIWKVDQDYDMPEELELLATLDRYSSKTDVSWYKPGSVAGLRIDVDNSDHVFIDVSKCPGFTFTDSYGNEYTQGTFYEETSPDYDGVQSTYTNGGVFYVSVQIPDNCKDGEYTIIVKGADSEVDDSTGQSNGTILTVGVTITIRESEDPDEIYLSKSEITIHEGDDKRIDATMFPEYIMEGYYQSLGDKYVTWKTSDDDVASIDAKGNRVYITGVSSGTATVTASCGDASAFCKVTVVECDYTEKVIDDEHLASPATCTEQATYYYECSCGNISRRKTFKAGALADHSYSDWETVTEATETTSGLKQRTCSGCGGVESEAIPATGHITHIPDNEWHTDENNHWHECTNDNCNEILDKAAHADNDSDGKCDKCDYVVETEEPHEHDFGTEWKSDENGHWYECECGEKSDEASHADENSDGKCDECDYVVETEEPHEHEFGTEWESDENGHWYECECGEKSDEAAHADEDGDGKCDECDYVVETEEPHEHEFGTEWESDETSHWHECECGEKSDEAAHADEDGDGKCDKCDYVVETEEPHEHEPATEWESDETYHWHECSGEDCDELLDKAAHADEDGDGKCDECDYVVETEEPHEHEFGTEWESDETGHWHECECGEKSDEAAHADEDGDGMCDECDYVVETEEPHEHEFGTEWESDEAGHWHECECGEKADEAEHAESTWIIDEYATELKEGSKHTECTVCGYVMQTESIPVKESDFEYDDWYYHMMILMNQKYTITANAGAGGSISNEGKTAVKFSNNITYTITPDDGYEIEAVIVDGKNVGAVSEYTFKRVQKDHTISVIFTEIKWDNPFTDIVENDWYYEDVEFVYENDLMIGTSDTKFSPDAIVNRAMIVTILWRLEGSPIVDSSVDFTDVPAGEWYTDAVNWASANGIVNGYGDDTFGPLNDLTREQIMAILNRYAAYKGWTDDAIFSMIPQYDYSIWAENNVIWADMNGMFDDIGVDVSDLTKAATRAEMAAYLRRFCENIAE